MPEGTVPMLDSGAISAGAELHDLSRQYATVQAALGRLATDSGNIEAAFLLFRAFTALGLAGPALEMLDESGPLSAIPELQPLRGRLAAITDGRLSRKVLEDRFDRNAAALYARHPDLRRHDAAFRQAATTYGVYRTIEGHYQLRALAEAGPGRWTPPLRDVSQLVSGTKLPHDAGGMFCSPYVVLSDHFATLLSLVYDGTSRMFLGFTPRIYVLEPEVATFGAMLHALESVDRLVDERVEVLVGPDCVEAMGHLLEADSNRLLPDYVMSPPGIDDGCRERCVACLRELGGRREQAAFATSERVRQYYAGLREDHWLRRYGETPSPSLRVLGVTSRFTTVLQHSMRDVKAAFEEQGHEFRLLIEENDHDLLPPIRTAEAIDEFKPDLMFYIDHLRREYPRIIPPGVPMVCWIQDQLPNLTTVEAGRSIGPLDFYIVPAYRDFVQEYGYPARQGMLWSMATNPRVYSNERLSEAELAPYRCDFSFVSNQSQLPRRFHEEFVARHAAATGVGSLAEWLYRAAEDEVHRQPEMAGGRRAMAVLADARSALGLGTIQPDTEDKLCRFYYQPLRELMFRQSTLEWVAEYCDRTGRTLHLYGNGWERHPRLGQYARGVAANGQQLRAIYQATRISLQCTSYGAVHQRLLDGLAAGGFFLIRRCPFDTCNAAVQQLLEAVQRRNLAPGRRYDPAELPEVVDPLRVLSHSHACTVTEAELFLRAADLDHFRTMQAAGFRQVAGAVFDRYADVAFSDGRQLAALADRYLEDENARREIMTAMRSSVMSRFTTAALTREMLEFIRRRL